jgi:uncharacterized membrane protein YdjX (TVP38/TMEM64 family)
MDRSVDTGGGGAAARPIYDARRSQRFVWIGALLALGLLAWQGHRLETALPRFESAIEGLGAWGPLLFFVAVVVLESFFVPDTLFALAAGAAFGPVHGAIYYACGLYLNCLMLHWIGGRWLKAPVLRQLERREQIRTLVAKAAAGGTRLTFVARLVPVNQAALSYALGAAGVPLRSALLGNFGMFPHALPTVFVGTAAVHMTRMAGTGHSRWELDALLGMLALGALIGVAHRLMRRVQ